MSCLICNSYWSFERLTLNHWTSGGGSPEAVQGIMTLVLFCIVILEGGGTVICGAAERKKVKSVNSIVITEEVNMCNF